MSLNYLRLARSFSHLRSFELCLFSLWLANLPLIFSLVCTRHLWLFYFPFINYISNHPMDHVQHHHTNQPFDTMNDVMRFFRNTRQTRRLHDLHRFITTHKASQQHSQQSTDEDLTMSFNESADLEESDPLLLFEGRQFVVAKRRRFAWLFFRLWIFACHLYNY